MAYSWSRISSCLALHVYLICCMLCVCVCMGLCVCVCVCVWECVCVCMCECVCVCKKKEEQRPKIGIHWPEKSHFKIAVWCRPGWIVTVNSSALQAVEWGNPSTSCYGFCRSIAIIASGDGRQRSGVCVRVCILPHCVLLSTDRQYVVFREILSNPHHTLYAIHPCTTEYTTSPGEHVCFKVTWQSQDCQ